MRVLEKKTKQSFATSKRKSWFLGNSQSRLSELGFSFFHNVHNAVSGLSWWYITILGIIHRNKGTSKCWWLDGAVESSVSTNQKTCIILKVYKTIIKSYLWFISYDNIIRFHGHTIWKTLYSNITVPGRCALRRHGLPKMLIFEPFFSFFSSRFG